MGRGGEGRGGGGREGKGVVHCAEEQVQMLQVCTTNNFRCRVNVSCQCPILIVTVCSVCLCAYIM